MCQINQEIPQQYIDGTLEPHEKLIFEEHLRECDDCRRVLNRFKILDWNLTHIEIEIPTELESVRENAIAEHFATEESTKLDAKAIYNLQRQALGNSVAFLQHMPYSHLVGESGARLAEKTGKSLKKRVSRSILKKFGIKVG